MSARLLASWPDWGRHTLKLFAMGAAAGVAGYFAGRLAFDLFPDIGAGLPEPRLADIAAVILAFALVTVSAGVALATLRPATLGRILKLDGPASPGEIRDVRLQSAVMALSGVLMVLPLAFVTIRAPATLSISAILILMAVHTVLNLKVFRSVDELFRRIAVEAGALTFWIGVSGLFLFAVAERLGVAAPLTGWDVYVVLMGVYLVMSMIVTVRRGLA